MVPLPSHRLNQWGQLGEILGGVKVPECAARHSPAAAHSLGDRKNTRHCNQEKPGRCAFAQNGTIILAAGPDTYQKEKEGAPDA